MFRGLTDEQMAQLHAMMNVDIHQHNSLHVFALAAVTLMKFEVQAEMERRKHSPRVPENGR